MPGVLEGLGGLGKASGRLESHRLVTKGSLSTVRVWGFGIFRLGFSTYNFNWDRPGEVSGYVESKRFG